MNRAKRTIIGACVGVTLLCAGGYAVVSQSGGATAGAPTAQPTPQTPALIQSVSTQLPGMTPTELAESSDLIVVGTVTSKSDPFLIDPVSDKEPRFFTDVYVRTDTVVKGTPQLRNGSDDEIVVRVEGGEGDGIATVNDGTPELKPGQQLALFLYQLKDGTYYNTEGNHYYIVGVGTGAWKMTSDGKFESPCWQQDGNQEISQDELTTVAGLAPVDASKQPAEGTNAALDEIEADFKAGRIDEQQRQSYLDQAHREATEFARIMTPEEQAAYAHEAIASHAE